MSAGRGTPRVKGAAQTPSGSIVITSDRWIDDQPLTADPITLTAEFQTYPLGGYQVRVGALRAGMKFSYVPAEAGAELEFQIKLGDWQYLVPVTAPVADSYNGQVQLYRPSYLMPAADEALSPISGYFEVPVQLAGNVNLLMDISARENSAETFGTFQVTRVFCANFGGASPTYPVV